MVILVTWVIAILIIYMGFLACLDPILNRRGINVGYREQRNELEDDNAAAAAAASAPQVSSHPIAAASINRSVSSTTDEDESEREGGAVGGHQQATPMRTYGSSVINRVGNTQTRWKRQVQEQRKNIYDKHTMLN